MSDDELLDYFIAETNRKIDRIEEKLDQLLEFKWQIMGSAAVMGIIVTVLIEALIK